MSTAEDMLAKAEADLAAFINRPQYGGRGSIELRVAYWEAKVKAERHRAAKPERDAAKAAKAEAHAAMDLRARYGACSEVRWSLSGGWLTVVRWNRKTVTVEMGFGRESIPHDQIAGAR